MSKITISKEDKIIIIPEGYILNKLTNNKQYKCIKEIRMNLIPITIKYKDKEVPYFDIHLNNYGIFDSIGNDNNITEDIILNNLEYSLISILEHPDLYINNRNNTHTKGLITPSKKVELISQWFKLILI